MAAKEQLVHGWHSPDCGRGTSDILWSCLATILLCVWTVIHLPIPCCSRFEDGTIVSGEPSRSWRNWFIRSGIVPAVISVVAPEFLTVTALGECIGAWEIRKQMTQINWTLTHSFFLHMGGFCLETPSGLRLQLDARMVTNAISAGTRKGTRSPDWLPKLEKVKETHINDHAKSNPLTKLVACGQALWLVTQVISRVYRRQAITPLEITTLAYAVCALIAYVAWWKRPQNSTVPITILCSDGTLPEEVTKDSMYYSEVSWKEYVWAGQHWIRHTFSAHSTVMTGLFALCPALFGAIHVASWNIKLLTNVEQWLWRASALYCCTAGLIFNALIMFNVVCEDYFHFSEATLDTMYALTVVAFVTVYVIARLYMIVEVFLSLRALPASAYESVQWSSFVPHI